MEAVHHSTIDEETAMPPALLSFFQRLQASACNCRG